MRRVGADRPAVRVVVVRRNNVGMSGLIHDAQLTASEPEA
jgi:hypothetical protein